jgi:hypothetical protein
MTLEARVDPNAIVWNGDEGYTALRIYREGEEYDSIQLDLSEDRDEWERLADKAIGRAGYTRTGPWSEDPITVFITTKVVDDDHAQAWPQGSLAARTMTR